jgi:chromosome partitioning protein
MSKQTGPIAVCVINLKGGVGKSTIAALLARQAFRRNLDVLAIDLDPQANLSQGLMHGDYREFLSEQRPSIVEIFNGFISPSSNAPSPTPLPANTPFEVIAQSDTRSLQLIPSRFDFSDNLLGAIRPEPKTLAKFLASNFKHKDLIIIDCSPTESILTTAAYHASGYVLVPVKPEYFATIGFPLLRQSLDNFKSRNRGNHISVAGVVINNAFYDGGNNGGPEKARALREIKEEANKNGWKVYTREIEHSRGYPKIMRGDYSYSGNAQYFSMFGNEFLESIGL